MKLLEDRIRRDGKILPGDILKVDSFLNHQIDVKLIDELGEEFHRLFADTNPNKIVTIEASGIAIAAATSRHFDSVPILFAKKTAASNMDGNTYQAKERSYTRNVEYTINIAKEYLGPQDRVLLIDEFLANGEAMIALINICEQAGAKIEGIGAVICKTYQPGIKRLADLGYDVKILAKVKAMGDDGSIEFEE